MPTNGSADFAWSPASQSDRGARGGLPNNTEAEANVLAAMMLSNEVVEEALVELLPDDFYRPSQRRSSRNPFLPSVRAQRREKREI